MIKFKALPKENYMIILSSTGEFTDDNSINIAFEFNLSKSKMEKLAEFLNCALNYLMDEWKIKGKIK